MNEIISKQIVDDEVLQAFLKTLPNQLTEGEKIQFLQVAQGLQLNPFKREIHCIAFGTGQYRQFSLITGYEVYLKRASRIGRNKGWKAWTDGELERTNFKIKRKQSDGTWKEFEVPGWKGSLVAKVEILIDGWAHPFEWEVEFDEYNQKNSMWNDKPKTMIKKVAIGQAFRMAFPDEMGSLPYMAEEVREMPFEPTDSQPEIDRLKSQLEDKMNNCQDIVLKSEVLDETQEARQMGVMTVDFLNRMIKKLDDGKAGN